MKFRVLVLSLALASVSLAVAPDVPLYPGAAVEEEVGKALRKSNPEGIAYNTSDAFDKVDAFYKKSGSEDVPHTRSMNPGMKLVVLKFPAKKFNVQLSWVAADKRHGTTIQFFVKQ